ncbi:3-hydroxyacyl-CoA dehydrogenase [Amylibacter ulvae]|uniref:3-hydroxyacyl-CoA dehydrogenase n=1 Tax=Paramylibacter ulvae TaxID=1651968 RepID=A0ABQ3CWN5_9RHOB|nr:3-hydroxyacyl-CoA dehydrogenase/enoyl-CoA hydratase family protein [Amylibacter ulvae]GHA44625.1 3-hydroxyacyl-CoA dehydrogenase [Amylibacter ulvae]
MTQLDFNRIAVIGAGTMGSGIAAQIANAGQKVLLLDLPRDDDRNGAGNDAIKRLLKSDPPALMDKSRADLIEIGNIEDDFHRLSECDWIVEAIVERLPLKKALYKRMNDVISDTCVVTSNTSTIPISLLVEDMDVDFRKRFAITHYFNPVRYMRLLELVRGADTAPDVMDRLSRYNDEVLGKGVVPCNDTPGFLGNRVGVFALQVGMDEAAKLGLPIEQADALMGRPMGIPKTGVFGLYDMIGVDLMADVVDTLGAILPADDVAHAVGWPQNPMHATIKDMIANGFTGNKGAGGFYRPDSNQAMDIATGELRPRIDELPTKAVRAADDMLAGRETLHNLLDDSNPDETLQTKFCRAFLARVLCYAADLIPAVTHSPQDIDDAMKLGFNWIRGPFEMIDALGADMVAQLAQEAGLDIPATITASQQFGPFYHAQNGVLNVRVFKTLTDHAYAPISLPDGTIRFSMMRQTMQPIASNASASLFKLDGDLHLVEFHSKANALTGASMEIVAAAAKNHGAGILVHNDAQHFSAGVDLNHFRTMIEAADWDGIDAFLNDFQQAVKALKYAPVPVIGAPSGLGLGGGYEVLAHCDKLVAHSNSVLGLVEASVGVIPSGGGVKDTMWRWYQATGDWERAAWETWMQVGYSQTGSSPETSARYQYFQADRDIAVMNRDKLVARAMDELQNMSDDYTPPTPPEFQLPGRAILQKMSDFMDDGIKKGWFFPHDKTVAMTVATIVVNVDGDEPLNASEQDMYDRERAAFITLAKTPETLARITSMLDDGAVVRN